MADEKVQFLINNLQESIEVEVKNWLNGLANREDQARLAKEIIALANSGGGYIFIGFDDEGVGLPELEPQAGEFEGFTQDNVSNLVERYVMPPCQCGVEYYQQEGSEIVHPVINVPGRHRTPLWANRGAATDELQNGRVYIRRQGGRSEVARNQDDWEKLIDRLVEARQSDMLGAIREILNPSSRVLAEEESSLDEWDSESYDHWNRIVNEFPEDDPRRLTQGHWTVSFLVEPFATQSLGELNTVLDREIPKYSGWPPFTYLHRDPVQPEAHGAMIQAYLGRLGEGERPEDRAQHCDFWRVDRGGYGYMLRPMQEDQDGYVGNVWPRPQGPFFDWIFPIYRITEVLKYIEALGQKFGDNGSEFELMLRYYKTKGRKLHQRDFRYLVDDGATCRTDNLESRVKAPIAEIQQNLEEIAHAILSPIYEQFDFTALPRNLVDNVTREALGFRR